MKIKIIVIICCMLLIGTILPSTCAIEKIKNGLDEKSCNDSFDNLKKSNIVLYQVEKLVSPTGNCEDFFGHTITMVNDMLWVGSPRDDTAGDDVGAVYTYIKNENTWTIYDVILPSDACDNNDFMVKHFGYSIAVDPDNPDVVVIGSPCSGNNDTGAVYIFYRNSEGQWIEKEKLNPPTSTPENSRFGSAVDIDNNKIIIGAPTESNIIGAFVGNAYIYEKDINGNWIFKQKLSPIYVCDGAFFGSTVLINENSIFIGAPYIQPDACFGKVFIFNRLDTSWYLEQTVTAMISIPNDRFGSCIDIYGDNLIIGSSRHGCLPPFGRVNIFNYESNWTSIQEFSAPNQTYNDCFGGELVINEHDLLVGAPNYNYNGAVFLYDFIDDEAVFNSMIIAPDGMNFDLFGSSLALSSNTVAIGAYLHDANATDDGAVYIYELNHPPNKPIIDGQTSGKTNTEYEFVFNATDPDDDAVMYIIDWGDNNTEWTEYGDSGEEIILKHTWTSKGKFTIKAKAKDTHGAESDWRTLEVTMPKNKPFIHNFPLLSWLLERFPNMFPIIRHMLGL